MLFISIIYLFFQLLLFLYINFKVICRTTNLYYSYICTFISYGKNSYSLFLLDVPSTLILRYNLSNIMNKIHLKLNRMNLNIIFIEIAILKYALIVSASFTYIYPYVSIRLKKLHSIWIDIYLA